MSRDVSPVTSHSTIPPTCKARTRPSNTYRQGCVPCPLSHHPRRAGTSSMTRATGHAPHVHCPFHPPEPGRVPSTTCHWEHVPYVLSLLWMCPHNTGATALSTTRELGCGPGHVPLGMSHLSLPAVGTGMCPQCHIKCACPVHHPPPATGAGCVPRETWPWGRVPCAPSHHPAVAGTFLHATCYWGHIPPVEQGWVVSARHVPPGRIPGAWSQPMACVPLTSLQT